MNCRKCRKEIPDGAAFCQHCGAKQTVRQRVKARGNGQGSAWKRGSSWTAVWTTECYVTEEDGQQKLHQKRRTKSGFASKTAALAYAANPPADRPAEKAEEPTLRYYWTLYKKSDYLDLSSSKKTAMDVAWKKLERIAPVKTAEITIDDLQSIVDQKAPTFYPAKDMKTLLSHLLKRAVAEGNARTNLAEFIRLPSLEEKEMQPFNEEELYKLWDAYGKGDRIAGFSLLMIYTGMMPGELLQMKTDMIFWEDHEIRGCGLKTKKRKVTPIVFPDMISPVLQDLVSSSTSKSGYIVGMQKDRFYAAYHKSMQAAGVRDLPPYSCRHTTATALALGNIAPSVIQEVMRHSKFSTTQRYIHPDTSSAVAAVNTLSKGKKS